MGRGHDRLEQQMMREERIRSEKVKVDAVQVCLLLCEGKVGEAKRAALKVIHNIGKPTGAKEKS